MQFGTKYKDASSPSSSGGGSGKWIRAFKEGETRLRFLQEMEEWVVYYEHYNPMGTAFPCTGDRNSCPGCTSTNERMKSASRKTAAVALVGNYVDVYKLPVKVVNRLSIRAERNNGTITDRDYLITRIGKDKDTEYDVESGNAAPVDIKAYDLPNIEEMLATSFRENFPDFEADQVLAGAEKPKSEQPTPSTPSSSDTPIPQPLSAQRARKETNEALAAEPQQHADGKSYGTEVPPSEPAAQEDEGEQEFTLDQLKMMTPDQLRTLCKSSGAEVPEDLNTQVEIIAWMEKQFA